ncbi:MAG: hypothetical protein WD994_02845, partial [Pseudomonadales bacterium]
GKSDQGKVGELEAELEDSLIVFDDKILQARTSVLNPGSPAQNSLPSTADDLPGSQGTAKRRSQEDTTEVVTSGANSEGNVPMSEREESEEQVALNIPDDVGNGQNDDIVAQQLREAAISETDPKLREKLWEEYKRYKAGL